jgi:lipopolysaccharide transport system permease protein
MTASRGDARDVVAARQVAATAGQGESPARGASALEPHAVAADDGAMQIIRPPRDWELIDIGQLWQYRELAWVLATRDFKVRYKQAVVGAAWAVIQPAALAAVFAVFFPLLGSRPVSPNVPLIVSFYCALLPWQLFATALKGSTESLLAHQAMIKKIYFPRIILPAVPIATAVIDFCIAFSVLVLMMIYYQIAPTWHVLWLPALVLFAAVTALAIGLWFSAMTALYRDLRHVVPVLIQLWFFLSPVVYETNKIVPERYRGLYALNPMVGVIDGFRWALLGGTAPDVATMSISIASVAVLLLGGAFYFRRMERVFVDWI